MIEEKRLAILISGTGTNMSVLLDACEAPDYPARAVLVLSNRPDAPGLEKARSRGVASICIDHKTFDDRSDFERELQNQLNAFDIQFIALAGFLRVLSSDFVERWDKRLVNIHPSLLPSFPGLNTHKRAIEAGCRLSGCTVHYVTSGVDEGPIIAQGAVPVMPDDTPATLANRVQKVEHVLYPNALEAALRNRTDRARIQLIDTEPEVPMLINTP